MSVIMRKGVVQHGQVVVNEPINLPDGSELTIMGYPKGEFTEEDERPLTPDEIVASLAAMDKMEPFSWTEEERAAWDAEKQSRKEYEKAHFQEEAEKLRRMWP